MTKTCIRCQKPIDKSNPNHRKMKYCSLPCFKESLRKTPDQAFWPKVNKDGPGGCWEWTGALQRDGYAHFVNPTNRKTISSHRYAYEQLVGPIPEGMDLLHSCDNRKCVNPTHLRPGTHGENMLEAKVKGRRVAKLTPEQVREIKRELRENYRHGIGSELAKRYGVADTSISAIKKGLNWSHIE